VPKQLSNKDFRAMEKGAVLCRGVENLRSVVFKVGYQQTSDCHQSQCYMRFTKLDKHLQEHLRFCHRMFDLVKDYLITINRRETTMLIAHQDANTSRESPRLVCPLYPLKCLITPAHVLAGPIYPSTDCLGFDLLKQDSIQFPELSDDLTWTHLWTNTLCGPINMIRGRSTFWSVM